MGDGEEEDKGKGAGAELSGPHTCPPSVDRATKSAHFTQNLAILMLTWDVYLLSDLCQELNNTVVYSNTL